MTQPAAQKDDWTRAFEVVEYPTSISIVRREVMDIGGLDHEVIDLLNSIDDGADFDSEEQLLAAVRATYRARGVESPI
jgi:hypothetical protein